MNKTQENEKWLKKYGFELHYQKKANSDSKPEYMHIHIDAQAPVPLELIDKIKEMGIFPSDFDHNFRIYGADGNPDIPFRHQEPINHMTLKTSDPEIYGKAWIDVISLLKDQKTLVCERMASTGLRAANSEEEIKFWEDISRTLGNIKYNNKYEVTDNDMSNFHKAGFDDVYNIGTEAGKEDWKMALLAKTEKFPFYLEGELIPFDKTLEPKIFNENEFKKLFPIKQEQDQYSMKADFIPQGFMDMPFKIDLVNLDPEKGEHFRAGEIHITVREEGAEPKLLKALGMLGFSGPGVKKYLLDENNDFKLDKDGKPNTVTEIPFTVQCRDMRDARKMAHVVVSIMEKSGGFEHASIKTEPINNFYVQNVDYNREMPKCIGAEKGQGLIFNPEFLEKNADIAQGIIGRIAGPIGSFTYSPSINDYDFTAKLSKIGKVINTFYKSLSEEKNLYTPLSSRNRGHN